MQVDIVLKLVTMLSRDVHKPSIAAREFKLDAAENYHMRTSGRNLDILDDHLFSFVSSVLPHKLLIRDGNCADIAYKSRCLTYTLHRVGYMIGKDIFMEDVSFF